MALQWKGNFSVNNSNNPLESITNLLFDNPYWKIIVAASVLLGIIGFFLKFSKYDILNKLKGVEIGGFFTGGSKGKRSTSKKIKNKLKNVTIKKDFTGGDKD